MREQKATISFSLFQENNVELTSHSIPYWVNVFDVQIQDYAKSCIDSDFHRAVLEISGLGSFAMLLVKDSLLKVGVVR